MSEFEANENVLKFNGNKIFFDDLIISGCRFGDGALILTNRKNGLSDVIYLVSDNEVDDIISLKNNDSLRGVEGFRTVTIKENEIHVLAISKGRDILIRFLGSNYNLISVSETR